VAKVGHVDEYGAGLVEQVHIHVLLATLAGRSVDDEGASSLCGEGWQALVDLPFGFDAC